jgi:hypothetical protein
VPEWLNGAVSKLTGFQGVEELSEMLVPPVTAWKIPAKQNF